MSIPTKDIKADYMKNGYNMKNFFVRTDGWANAVTGAGRAGFDSKVDTVFELQKLLTDQQLSNIYRGDGLGKRIVDIPAKDMVRAWFTIEGDAKNDVPKALDLIGARKAFKQGIMWARLYGGSLIVMGIDDGRKPTERSFFNFFSAKKTPLEFPLKEDKINSIGFFRVYTKDQITWDNDDINKDPADPNFGMPDVYTITPVLEQASSQFKVHWTRTLRFVGEELPEREAAQQRWWGDSVLQSVFTRLRGFGDAMTSTEKIIDEFIMGVMEIANLQDLVADGNEDLLQARLQQIDLAKHMLNTILVDKEEKYTRTAAQVNGIKDILSFFKDVLSAVAGIPQIKLFGEQSKGLGSQAAGNIRLYYDDIMEFQESMMRIPITRLVSILLLAEEFSERATNIAPDWDLKFKSLFIESNKEIAESRHLIAKSDSEYIKNKVLTPKEVADSRFGGETFSTDTILNAEGDKMRKNTSDPSDEPNLDGIGTTSSDKGSRGEAHTHEFEVDRTGRGFTDFVNDHAHRIVEFQVKAAGATPEDDHIHFLPVVKMDRATPVQQAKVAKVMEEFRKGKLKSSSGKKVISRSQAIAIALSEAGLSKEDLSHPIKKKKKGKDEEEEDQNFKSKKQKIKPY